MKTITCIALLCLVAITVPPSLANELEAKPLVHDQATIPPIDVVRPIPVPIPPIILPKFRINNRNYTIIDSSIPSTSLWINFYWPRPLVISKATLTWTGVLVSSSISLSHVCNACTWTNGSGICTLMYCYGNHRMQLESLFGRVISFSWQTLAKNTADIITLWGPIRFCPPPIWASPDLPKAELARFTPAIKALWCPREFVTLKKV